MALTLADVSVGLADKVAQGVIDEFRRGSFFMDQLIFDDAVSPGTSGSTMTYGYQQLSTPSTATGRAINEEYTANEAKRVKKTVDLKIFGGSSAIDRVLQKTSGEKEVAFQLKQKVEATRNHFLYTCINGSKTDNVKDFDGLSALLKGKSTEYNAGSDSTVLDLSTSEMLDANYRNALDMLDEFISGLDGKPGILAGNSKVLAKLRAIARRDHSLTHTMDRFGEQASGYDNIVFCDMKQYYNPTTNKTEPSVPIYQTGSGGNIVTGLTDLYAIKIDLDAFHGVSMTGDSIIHQYLPDFKAPGAVKKVEVEMVAAVALKNTTKCGVFRNIKVV